MDEKPLREEGLGTYEAESGEVRAKLDLKARIIDTEIVVGFFTHHTDSGEDYYFSNISFSTSNHDSSRFVNYESKVNFNLGCSYIGDIFKMLRDNAHYIAALLDPRHPKDSKWDVVKCAFSLEEQTKHLYQERRKAREERQLVPPST